MLYPIANQLSGLFVANSSSASQFSLRTHSNLVLSRLRITSLIGSSVSVLFFCQLIVFVALQLNLGDTQLSRGNWFWHVSFLSFFYANFFWFLIMSFTGIRKESSFFPSNQMISLLGHSHHDNYFNS